ncbi:hypothetical protein ACFZCL_39590 [Streptomyces sp. NPDC008159]|uniref:hypothetical protein n=1 Tax=Streptomyces sp. NPDC008159 TaxID=3364817 RepID=UPI0036F0D3CF
MSTTENGVRSAPRRAEHAEQVLAIHQLGVDEGNATVEATAPTWQALDMATTRRPPRRP